MSDHDGGTDLAEVWRLLEAEDIAAVMRRLRFVAERIPITELARIVGRAATAVGFGDLADTATAVVDQPTDPETLYNFGYSCVERGTSYLAIPALAESLRHAPGSRGVLIELVTALEGEQRHTEVVELLEARDATIRDWPERYLLAYNAACAGDLDRAAKHTTRLPRPEDERWAPAYDRVPRILERAERIRAVSPLDPADLRGWHFTLTGGILETLSPYGFAKGMHGRFAYLQDAPGACLSGLQRLRLVLEAAEIRPTAVVALPDRSSQIIGRAAGTVLDLPLRPHPDADPAALVVAYDLTAVEEQVATALADRPEGQLLFEHATCWTDPPEVTADISVLLHQVAIAPWGEQVAFDPDGSQRQAPADDRPVAELAEEILRADPALDPGDGTTPADPDASLAAFVAAARPVWPVVGAGRERSRSSGPVRSSRFW